MLDYGSMETNLAQMEDLIDQLAGLGKTFAEHLRVAFFKVVYLIATERRSQHSKHDITQELMKNKLLEEYNRRMVTNSMSNEGVKRQKAMKTISEERRPRTSTISAITCHFFKKPNHIKKECRKYIERKKRR